MAGRLAVLVPQPRPVTTILTVGSGKQFATMAAAYAAASAGNTIQIFSGTYNNDYVNIAKNLTIVGMGATPDLVKFTSTGNIPGDKAIWLVNAPTVSISNIEMSGAAGVSGNDEAIRWESGTALTLNAVWIHDCQTGLLANAGCGTLTITACEFNNCGIGDGQTHNLYAGVITALVIQGNSFFHDAVEGHEIKSRALSTTIINSRIFDNLATCSYTIDIPVAGTTLIQGNVIQQGVNSDNPSCISYDEEPPGAPENPSLSLSVLSNTIINDLVGSPIGVRNVSTATAQVNNNNYWGLTSGQLVSGTNSQSGNTLLGSRPTLDQSHPWAPGALSRTLGLQNTSGSSIPAHPITFGQTFLQGNVPAGSQLTATIDGVGYDTQLDWKNAYPDGSCKFGVLAFKHPAIAANTTKTATLTTRAPSGSAIDLAGLVASGYNVDVSVVVSGGSTYTYDVGTLLNAAISGGQVSYWQQGPQVTEGRIDQYLTNALHIIFDIAWFADGTHRTVIQFCNDYALQASGGTLTYDATISLNGSTWYTKAALVHYQYSVWSKDVWSAAPAVHVRHDSQKLMDSKLVHNFMLTVPPPSAWISIETAAMAKPLWGAPLVALDVASGQGNNAVYGPDMGDTGARPDIGPITGHQAIWLQTQDETQLKFILGQADASGSIPINFFDPSTKLPPSIVTYPNLRIRQDGGSGTNQLTQPIPSLGVCNWAINVAHHPALTYVPYLATGKRFYLDRTNTIAAWCIFDAATDHRGFDQAWMFNTFNETRNQAWALRAVQHAYFANPDGSAARSYWQTIVNNNYSNFATSIVPTFTTSQGETYGLLRGDEGDNGSAAWQQGYVMTTAAAAAENVGSADTTATVNWLGHFLTQGILAPTMNPYDMACYYLTYYNDGGSPPGVGITPIGTWAGVEAATIAAGHSNGNSWATFSGADYITILQCGLNLCVTQGTANAVAAAAWVAGSSPPVHLYQNAEPNWSIIPRA